jgi:hypothetical protein
MKLIYKIGLAENPYMSILSRFQKTSKVTLLPKSIIEPPGLWPRIDKPEPKVPTNAELAIAKMDPILATKLTVYLVMKGEGLTLEEIRFLASNDSVLLGMGYKPVEKT